jgi:hypothetical protein
MSRVMAAIHRDVTHKHIALTSVTVAQLSVSCVQHELVSAENRASDGGSKRRLEETA